MPVPPKLSHRLRDALGEEAAVEMVDWMQRVDAQRGELRDLNELNFARIDARFREFGTRLEHVETRLEHVETRLERVETRLERVEARLDQMDARLDGVEQRIVLLDTNMRRDLEVGLARVESKIDQRFSDVLKWSLGFSVGTVVALASAFAAVARFLL